MEKQFFDSVRYERSVSAGSAILNDKKEITINLALFGLEPEERSQIEKAANDFINLAKEVMGAD